MKILGSKSLRENHKLGEFYCPSCNTNQNYIWQKTRSWFTLFSIPLFPLDYTGEYIECQMCLSTYGIDVLQYGEMSGNNQEVLSVYQKGVRDIMILIMLADGILDPNEASAIRHIYSHLVRQEYKVESFNQDVERIQSQNPDLMKYAQKSIEEHIKKIRSMLNDDGKKLVYNAAISVALSDGNIAPEEQILLDTVIKELDIPRSDVDAITSEALKNQRMLNLLKAQS